MFVVSLIMLNSVRLSSKYTLNVSDGFTLKFNVLNCLLNCVCVAMQWNDKWIFVGFVSLGLSLIIWMGNFITENYLVTSRFQLEVTYAPYIFYCVAKFDCKN